MQQFMGISVKCIHIGRYWQMYLPVPERVSSTKHLHFGISRIVFAGPGMMVHLQFRIYKNVFAPDGNGRVRTKDMKHN